MPSQENGPEKSGVSNLEVNVAKPPLPKTPKADSTISSSCLRTCMPTASQWSKVITGLKELLAAESLCCCRWLENTIDSGLTDRANRPFVTFRRQKRGGLELIKAGAEHSLMTRPMCEALAAAVVGVLVCITVSIDVLLTCCLLTLRSVED